MNTVDQYLSDVCDYAESRLRSNPELSQELNALLTNGQQPHVLRIVDALKAYMGFGFTPEGAAIGANSQ